MNGFGSLTIFYSIQCRPQGRCNGNNHPAVGLALSQANVCAIIGAPGEP